MDKKYQAVHIASLLLLLIVGVPVYGGSDQLLGPLNYTDVAERKAQVRAIMTERLMYPFETINCRNSQYCVELIQAYRAQDKVEYPLPIAAGKDYFDPALDEIKTLCPNRLMNSGSTPETGPNVYLTRNLRYWRVDMDGDGDDELVLHGERRVRGRLKYLHAPDRLPEASPAAVIIPDGDGFFVDDPAQRGGAGDGWFIVYSLKSCEMIGGAPAFDTYHTSYQRPVNNVNDLIRYRDRIILVSLIDASLGDPVNENRKYFLNFHSFDTTENRVKPLCGFSEIGRLHRPL